MSQPTPTRSIDSDRNLLFGVLALQADVITNTQFIEACTLWASQKNLRLPELLLTKGWISTEDMADVDRLVERKLKKHAGNVQAGLAEAAEGPLQRTLSAVADPDIRRTLAGLPAGGGLNLPSTVAYQPESRQRYILTRVHAKGGIGQVWLARDDDLGREVALKELRPEKAGHQEAWARFLEEAQITGQLEHPGIVPVYELARRADNQQPFYTMRFVKGRTLTDACRAYHQKRQGGQAGVLDLRELLSAFVGVCNAVAYAHARGVLHRDLKGPNVVLGNFGEVIVLDWGLAKVAGKEAGKSQGEETGAPPVSLPGEAERAETLQGQALGTPGYMSPEQAEGRLAAIDRRSDVYGLGAILYEILTGRPPFTASDTQEILRKVTRELPLPPRAVVAATPPALEAICLKALAKKPADRYASVAEVAHDVQRFLADEPVSAYPDPLAARLARWARRHKASVSGAAALLLAAVAALSLGTVLLGQANARTEEQRDEARRQRDRANENFDKARQAVDDYFTQVSENTLLNSPLPGLQPLRKELLQTALKYYQGFVAEHRDDPSFQAELARAFFRVGKITSEIGSKTKALEAYQESQNLWEKLVSGNRDRPQFQSELAKIYYEIGWLQTYNLGQAAEGLTSLQQARTISEALVTNYPENAEFQSDLAQTLSLIGYWHFQHSQPAEEVHFREKSLAIWERLAAVNPKFQSELAKASTELGYYYTRNGKPTEASRSFGKARQIVEKLLAEKPTDSQLRERLLVIYTNLGYLHHLLTCRFDEALRFYQEARQVAEQLAHDNPAVTTFQSRWALSHLQIAQLQAEVGQFDAAARSFHQTIEIYKKLQRADRVNLDIQFNLGFGYSALGDVLWSAGLLDDAALSLQQARDLLEELARKRPENTQFQHNLGLCYLSWGRLKRDTGRTAEAIQFFQQAFQIWSKLLAEDANRLLYLGALADTHQNLGDLQRATGQLREAAQSYEQALTLREKQTAIDPVNARFPWRVAQVYLLLSQTQIGANNPAAAVQSLQRARDLLEKLPQANPLAQYTQAAVYAQLSTLVGAGRTELTAQEKAACLKYCNEAMATLGKALAGGYQNLVELKKDPSLEPLRSSDDFKKLLADLEKKKN